MKKLPVAVRIAVGISVPVLIAAGIFVFIKYGSPPCLFHAMTGIYCPGCGAGRALRALLELRIGDALQYNLLFTLSIPLALLYLIKGYVSVIAGREVMKHVRITDRGAWICCGVIIAFLILRNIPVKPFSYLSPEVFL